MLDLGKEIDDLKVREDEVYQKFLGYKQEYVALSGDKREMDFEERRERQAQKEQQRKERRKKEEEERKTLQQRAKDAEEKVQTGKKLTTEDILALQGLKK